MLTVSRKPMERILIGNDVCVTIVAVRGQVVRVSIEAPREVPIVRAEIAAGRSWPVPTINSPADLAAARILKEPAAP